MDIIKHGLPDHNCHGIVLPCSYIVPSIDAGQQNYKNPVQTFVDPVTKKKYIAEIMAIATLTVDEFIAQSIPALLAYGHNPKKVVFELKRRYPEIRKTNSLRFIVIKKL